MAIIVADEAMMTKQNEEHAVTQDSTV